MKLPDELRHPSGGEKLDRAAQDTVRLAHRALERFPELVRQHKFIAGGAAVSSALVVLAGVALTHRMRRGESAEEAVEHVTVDELNGLRILDVEQPADGTAPGAPANGKQPDHDEVSAETRRPDEGAPRAHRSA